MTINYLELVYFYILNGAAKRSARVGRAKQIAKLPKMSAFLKPADSAPPPPMTSELESNPVFHQRRGGGSYGNWHRTEYGSGNHYFELDISN